MDLRTLLIFALSISCFITTFGQEVNKDLKYSIVFASCFQNEVVSLKISEKLLIDSQMVASDPITGITSLSICQDSRAIWVIDKANKQQFPLIDMKNIIQLDIMANEKWTKLNLDLKHGKIIFVDNCFDKQPGEVRRHLTVHQYKKLVRLE